MRKRINFHVSLIAAILGVLFHRAGGQGTNRR